ncbi:hypothetical protein NC653_004897 [Populus alba x Populus x berolinensis]|uniref:Uncharacterized protein n=1 Tax=Populus alba x Populus x berolinensis TaxID=444605 RepID=A0AAD6WAE9_9ROSI|nr:hypothetical protein NC653_004897 [Populus alba x Populus x berolinensis]
MTVLNCINELILRRDWQIKSAVSMDSGLNPIFSRAVVLGLNFKLSKPGWVQDIGEIKEKSYHEITLFSWWDFIVQLPLLLNGDSGHLICCLGSVVVVEGIGALMYRASFPLVKSIRSIISVFNYWKAGLTLGLFLDSFKYEIDKISSFSNLFDFEDLIAHMRFASGKLCRVNSTGDFWIARLPRLKWAMENIIDAKVAVLCANIVFFSNSAMELWLRWKLKKDTGSGSYAFLIDTLHAQIAPSRQALVHPPLHTLHRCWMNCLCKMIRAHALSLSKTCISCIKYKQRAEL